MIDKQHNLDLTAIPVVLVHENPDDRWHWLRASLQFVKDPKRLSITFWLWYVAMFWLGLWVLVDTPDAARAFYSAQWWQFLTTIWPVSWMIGGMIGMATALHGWWIIERAAPYFILSGTVFYLGTSIWGHFLGETSRSAVVTMTVCALFIAVIRLLLISDDDIDPEKA